MSSLEDVGIYFEIFDDYLDFNIYPWDDKGHDEGVLYPERKTAIRYLTLAMNLYKAGPEMLPENLLEFMEEYQEPQYQKPEFIGAKKIRKAKKYDDLRNQVVAENNNNTSQAVPNNNTTGISNKELQGFDMKNRKGFAPSDVVVTEQSINMGKSSRGYQIVRDLSTRSVFFDNVPGEEALNPQTFDWRNYATEGDIKRQYEEEEQQHKKKKGKKTTRK